MDRAGPRPARLIAATALVAATGLIVAAAVRAPVLRAERWLAPGARFDALATQPRECLAAATGKQAALMAIGRTAFRTSELLGGQAAKLRLTCASCHTNGRRNAAFAFPGLSGDPGTADVTSAVMSSHRDNGVFDPRPIPDLAFVAKVSRDPGDPALGTFVHGIVTQEFDGADPGSVVAGGLLAYVRAIRACIPDTREAVTLDGALADVARAVAAAGEAVRLGDRGGARLMLGGARNALGDIDERYPRQPEARAGLRRADADLLRLQLALDVTVSDPAASLAAWRFPVSLLATLRRGQARSLYDRATLARALAAS